MIAAGSRSWRALFEAASRANGARLRGVWKRSCGARGIARRVVTAFFMCCLGLNGGPSKSFLRTTARRYEMRGASAPVRRDRKGTEKVQGLVPADSYCTFCRAVPLRWTAMFNRPGGTVEPCGSKPRPTNPTRVLTRLFKPRSFRLRAAESRCSKRRRRGTR